MERQRFQFLSNFMSKGHQSSHNENAATAWRQHNAEWWSEMKRKNKSEKMRTVPNKATENDDEAAGRLHLMELHRIIAAAVEGHNNKKQVAYHALQKKLFFFDVLINIEN